MHLVVSAVGHEIWFYYKMINTNHLEKIRARQQHTHKSDARDTVLQDFC